jgi:hypothetical protein
VRFGGEGYKMADRPAPARGGDMRRGNFENYGWMRHGVEPGRQTPFAARARRALSRSREASQ